MFKKLFFITLLALSAWSLDAQILKASFGIKGAGVGTMVSTNQDATFAASVGGGGGAFLGFKFANFLGVQAEAPYNCGMLSYGDTVYLNFIRNIREADLERHFFAVLRDLGLSVTVESNQN